MVDNRHVTVEDVNIYSSPGNLFFIDGQQQYWQFRRVRVVPPEGVPRRAITSTADYCHISRSCGFFKMENCEFSMGADDILNAHDCSGFAMKSGPNAITSRNINVRGIKSYRPGAEIELRHSDYSPTGFRAAIRSIRKLDEAAGIYEFTFDREVPEPNRAGQGFVMFNRSFGTRNLIIRNNYFHDSRLRGNLILASDVTIENNRFVNMDWEQSILKPAIPSMSGAKDMGRIISWYAIMCSTTPIRPGSARPAGYAMSVSGFTSKTIHPRNVPIIRSYQTFCSRAIRSRIARD